MDLQNNRNFLNERLGIPTPIIQAPLAGGATSVELVAAVSNAGGLGSFAAGYLDPSDIRQAINQIRALTNKPFAVNLFIPQAHSATDDQIHKAHYAVEQCCRDLNIAIQPIKEPYAPLFIEQIKVLIEEKIPVFSFAFGLLDSIWISRFKVNKTIIFGTATTLAEAKALEASGIDAIVAQGSEAGGHRGTFLVKEEDGLIKLNKLIPELVANTDIPIIAAGGIMNGEGIVAAMKLGASCVQMGTAFLTCSEAGISSAYKQILLKQQGDNTLLTRAFSGKLARGIRNQFTDCMENKKQFILEYPIQNALTTSMRQWAKENKNTDFMSLWAGQNARLCRQTTAVELLTTLILEMQKHSDKAT